MFFGKGPNTILTLVISDSLMGFKMLQKVAFLDEGTVTVEVSTVMRFLVCVCQHMILKLCHSVNNSITLIASHFV